MNEETDQKPFSVESLRASLAQGVADARESAKAAAPRAKAAMNEQVQSAAYHLAFGSSFAATFLKEFLPDDLAGKVRKGSTAGREAAQKAHADFQEAFHQPDTPQDLRATEA